MHFYQHGYKALKRRFRDGMGQSDLLLRNDPAALDRRADVELTAGHHEVAERLAHLAAEMRGAHA